MDEDNFGLQVRTPIKTPSMKPLTITLIILVLLYFVVIIPVLNYAKTLKENLPEAGQMLKKDVPGMYNTFKWMYWGTLIGYVVIALVSLWLVIRYTFKNSRK